MTSQVTHAAARDGTDLLVRHWPASTADAATSEAASPWAAVLIVHGLSDHSGRYEHVGAQLARAGLDAWAYDHRGNGGSAGRRGHVERWAELLDDLETRLDTMRTACVGRPAILYGHSMGGLIVLGYLLSNRSKPDLVVVTAPALDSALPGWKKRLARLLGRATPLLAIPNGIDGRTLSRDPGVAQRTKVDPLIARASTAQFGAEGLAEQARVRSGVHDLPAGIPILVLHGMDDGLVPPPASEPLATLPNVERRTYPGLRHELHNEPEGPAIIDEIVAWLRDRTSIAAGQNETHNHPNAVAGESAVQGKAETST